MSLDLVTLALAKKYTDEKAGGGDSGYTLPVGGENLGGVKNGGNVVINEDGTMDAPVSDSSQNVNPVAKTEDMTQPVGVDENGQLYTAPGGSGGDSGIIIECTMERYEKGTIWFDIASQNIPTGTSEHIKNALSSGCIPNVLVKCEWEYDRDNYTRYVVPYAFEADSSECIIYLMFHEGDEPQKLLIYV